MRWPSCRFTLSGRSFSWAYFTAVQIMYRPVGCAEDWFLSLCYKTTFVNISSGNASRRRSRAAILFRRRCQSGRELASRDQGSGVRGQARVRGQGSGVESQGSWIRRLGMVQLRVTVSPGPPQRHT